MAQSLQDIFFEMMTRYRDGGVMWFFGVLVQMTAMRCFRLYGC